MLVREVIMIEQKIFSRKRFRTDDLSEYGFIDRESCYTLSREFMDGDFTAEIKVYEDSTVRGRVTDNMTGEEYTPLRMPNYIGAFVGSVRAAYEEILMDIADKCCLEVDFASDQANRIASAILEKYGREPDFPWDGGRYGSAGVFRHGPGGKWFGLIMNIERRHLKGRPSEETAGVIERKSGEETVDIINLKAGESKVRVLQRMTGIYPAYHMNHSKWISITLDDTLADSDIMDLVEESFMLTSKAAGVLNEKLIREVLDVADSIPPGKVVSYGQIAGIIGRPKNARIVGKIMSMADRYGDHPCHRVVNSAGRTVPGWKEQRPLLEAEGVEFKANGCVDMKKYQFKE